MLLFNTENGFLCIVFFKTERNRFLLKQTYAVGFHAFPVNNDIDVPSARICFISFRCIDIVLTLHILFIRISSNGGY